MWLFEGININEIDCMVSSLVDYICGYEEIEMVFIYIGCMFFCYYLFNVFFGF